MSQFNFIYAEEHLSHREKAVYSIFGTGQTFPVSAGRGSKPLPENWDFRRGQSSGLWQIWSAGSSSRSGTAAAPTAASPAIYTG